MFAEWVVGDVYSKLENAPPQAWAIIREVCRARPEGYQWMPKFRAGQWDGYISLMRGFKHIPTGLLRFAVAALDEFRIESKYTTSPLSGWEMPAVKHFHEEIQHNILQGITLRDYQLSAARALLVSTRGIAKMATNAGKTLVFAALIKALQFPHTIIVVQSKDLLYQTADKLVQYLGIPIGVLGDSLRSTKVVTVATIQTLQSLHKHDAKQFLSIVKDNKILVVDECHHIAHNQSFDVLMEIPGWHRYGFSGTPLDRGALNDLKLIACTGPVEVDVSNADLIKAGWSAKPIIHMHEYQSSSEKWKAEYSEAYDTLITHNDDRNRAIVDLAEEEQAAGHSVLIIVTRIAHGKILNDLLDDEAVIFVNGSSPMDDRRGALEMLEMLDCIVISTNIFDEGVDVPSMGSIILACGNKSHIKLLQRIGRGLRRKTGLDNTVPIHDFIDGDNEYLLNHTERRLEVYEAEGFQIKHCRANNGKSISTRNIDNLQGVDRYIQQKLPQIP
jgi:superfamily II DNA or RNA helicase